MKQENIHVIVGSLRTDQHFKDKKQHFFKNRAGAKVFIFQEDPGSFSFLSFMIRRKKKF